MSKTFKHNVTKIRNSQTGEFESMPTLKGDDGVTPHIGANNHWYIGETDTGITAEGKDGAPGQDGQPGKSAYQYAQDGGYTGTEEEFSKKLAAEYLTEESDPTVPEWAKQQEKPSYTASEVGALPDSTVIPTVPDTLPNPHKLTFSGAVTAEYDGSGAVTVTIPEGSGGSGGTVRVEKLSTDTVMELESNKLYVFPEMESLTITLAEPVNTAIINEYHFVFQSGSTATTLTIPDTINVPSGFSVDANKIYEISILEGCLCTQSWAVS